MRHKKNMTLNLQSITSHLTDKEKIITLSFRNITLCSLILTLSSINIINTFLYIPNTSALSYQSSTDVKFTFNPTLSVNISSSDLVIDNLTPGTTSDSNIVNVSVTTNASHGYTLSATVGDSLHNNTNLTHTNGTNTFDSIATNSSLPNLTTDNTWGYSYRLSNNSNNNNNNSTWSNYSGLSNETSKILISTDNQITKPIDFKIAAKASPTQPSGIYTGTINFIAISKPIPKTIEDIAYMQTFGELNPTDLQSVKDSMILNQDYILKDSRDEKEYYVTRLEDGNVWMTQNLDLDLSTEKPLTSKNTDLNDASLSGAYVDGYSVENGLIEWTPERNTITPEDSNSNVWVDDYANPYSYDSGLSYPDPLVTERIAGKHGLAGNYYNWTAAIASNNSNFYNGTTGSVAINSICPKSWRLPDANDYEYSKLLYTYDISIDESGSSGYATENSFNEIISSPLWFVRAGVIYGGSVYMPAGQGHYWLQKTKDTNRAFNLFFTSSTIEPSSTYWYHVYFRSSGFSVRCLAR